MRGDETLELREKLKDGRVITIHKRGEEFVARLKGGGAIVKVSHPDYQSAACLIYNAAGQELPLEMKLLLHYLQDPEWDAKFRAGFKRKKHDAEIAKIMDRFNQSLDRRQGVKGADNEGP